MADIATPGKTIEILQKYNFRFRKSLGQNFLIDPGVIDKIIKASSITGEDLVIEIGPGIGSLTQALGRKAGAVLAVELDQNLIPILEENLAELQNICIIQGDILKTDLSALILERKSQNPGLLNVRVVANLPYYITTPIMMDLLEKRLGLKSITVMIQREVADRMTAAPGTKEYGALSLAVQYYAAPEIAGNVPPNCFLPRPQVGSAIVRLDLFEVPPVKTRDEKLMFQLIRGAFNQRRKTLLNALSNSSDLSFSKNSIIHAIMKVGLEEKIRGEALSLSQFASLTDALLSGKSAI